MCVGYLAVLAAFVLLWLVILISGLWPGGGSCFLRSLPVCLRGRSISLLRGLALFLPDRIVAGSLLVILLGVTRCGRGFLRYHDFFIGYSRFFGKENSLVCTRSFSGASFSSGCFSFSSGPSGCFPFSPGAAMSGIKAAPLSFSVTSPPFSLLSSSPLISFDLFLFEVFFDCFDFFDFFFRFVHFFLVVPVVISIMVTERDVVSFSQ